MRFRESQLVKRSVIIVSAIALAMNCRILGPQAVLALDPNALPVGAEIVSGSGTVSVSGNTLTATQSTDKMSVNWDTFNIGSSASVRFDQPGSGSVALNTITNQSPTEIMGSLSSNGQVFLVNPAGIIFGSTARVDVGGIVASTLRISDSDFMAGRYSFVGSESSAGIINQGAVHVKDGGYVAFLGQRVINQGIITTNAGTTLMAAGEKVSLDFNGDGLVSYSVDQGTVGAVVDNQGLIKSDGGVVVMTAKAANALLQSVVRNSGVIEAKTIQEKDGRILILSDMDNGVAEVGGTLDASAPGGGDGGFIETSAAHIYIGDDAVITTLSPFGLNGTWLIDPVDFTISTGAAALSTSGIGASTLASSLGTGNVTIATNSGTSGNGDIFVNGALSWSANTLTLSAHRNIDINAALTGSKTAKLAFEYGQGAEYANNTAYYTVDAPISLADGQNFSTKLGSNGTTRTFNVISDVTVLQKIGTTSTSYYALGKDIDASATSSWNSGAGFIPISAFSGRLEGLGNQITGLVINRPKGFTYGDAGLDGRPAVIDNRSESSIGLFKSITLTGIVSNLGLVGGSVIGDTFVGSIAASNSGIIRNVYNTGSVSARLYGAGGLVASNGGYILDSYNTGEVNGSTIVYPHVITLAGGIAGSNASGGYISDSYNTGTVRGYQGVGGLVADNSGTINNSHNSGSVVGATYSSYLEAKAYSSYIGGFVSRNYGSIYNSYNDGEVSGAGAIGGFVYQNSGTISGSSNTGLVVAEWQSPIYVSGSTAASGFAYEEFGGEIISSTYDPVSSNQTSAVSNRYDVQFTHAGMVISRAPVAEQQLVVTAQALSPLDVRAQTVETRVEAVDLEVEKGTAGGVMEERQRILLENELKQAGADVGNDSGITDVESATTATEASSDGSSSADDDAEGKDESPDSHEASLTDEQA